MIYVDSSVVLAHLLSEDRVPPSWLWRERLISSRLLEYEIWTRIHIRGLTESHSRPTRLLLDRFALLEMVPSVLSRALRPFPGPIRTLDALHLASIEFLRSRGHSLAVASYDGRMLGLAGRLGVHIAEI